MSKHELSITLLDLPQEIHYKIFEYVIPSEFYCEEIAQSESIVSWFSKKLERSSYGYAVTPNRVDLFKQFEQFQNYFLIHRDLFYRNLIECHCNRHLIDIWKKILLMHESAYRLGNRFKEFTCTQDILDLCNNAKAGDYQSVHTLIRYVLDQFNGPRTVLETFFKVEFKGEEITYPSYIHFNSYEILKDIFNPETSIKKIDYLKSTLSRCPSCTKDPKYFRAIVRQVYAFLISFSIYSKEIRKLKKKTSDADSKKVQELLLVLFSDCATIPLEGNIEYLSLIIATAKVVGMEDLFKQLVSKWVLNNPSKNLSHNLELILFENKNDTISSNEIFEYCVIESYLVKNQIDELTLLISKLQKGDSTKIIDGICEIISIFFRRYDLFQNDIEDNAQKIMNLISTCWSMCDTYCEKSFITILKALISSGCNKALHFKDVKPIIQSLEYFYFGLFSKKFLGTRLSFMDSIIEKSNILNDAIEHPTIFVHFMKNMGNSQAYRKQLKNICSDSSIFSCILSFTAHFMGNSDNVTFSYKLRIESNLYADSYELFEKRMLLVKDNLQNAALMKKSLNDKSTKFNTEIEKILGYCKMHHNTIIPLLKTMNKIEDFLNKIFE